MAKLALAKRMLPPSILLHAHVTVYMSLIHLCMSLLNVGWFLLFSSSNDAGIPWKVSVVQWKRMANSSVAIQLYVHPHVAIHACVCLCACTEWFVFLFLLVIHEIVSEDFESAKTERVGVLSSWQSAGT